MWQLGKACVIIHIKGKNAERMLNALRGDGVVLSRITRVSPDELRLSMRAKDFRHIRRYAGKLHCHIHIESRGGAAFVWNRLVQRRVLWIGGIVCLLLLIAASSRLWVIRVEGNVRVAESTVRRALREHGMTSGAPLPKGSFEALADALAASDERIAWIGLDLDGVCLTVSVVEAEYAPLQLDLTQPCDVVAVKDGVVTEVRTLDGEPTCTTGSHVYAGDVLISGLVELTDVPEPLLVHARGLVKANVYYFSETAQPLSLRERASTGACADYRRVSICGLTVFETKSPYPDFEVTDCVEKMIHFPLLPVTVCRGTYWEMAECERSLTEAEAAEMALVEAEQGALLRVPSDAAIVQKTGNWISRDGVVIATCAVVTEESIGMTKEIMN